MMGEVSLRTPAHKIFHADEISKNKKITSKKTPRTFFWFLFANFEQVFATE